MTETKLTSYNDLDSVGIRRTTLKSPPEALDSGLNNPNFVLTSEQLDTRQMALGRLVTRRQRTLPNLRIGEVIK